MYLTPELQLHITVCASFLADAATDLLYLQQIRAVMMSPLSQHHSSI